jgi:hypothetical protein
MDGSSEAMQRVAPAAIGHGGNTSFKLSAAPNNAAENLFSFAMLY